MRNVVRDKTIDIMSAIGILFVVMGHNYQPASFFLPAYMFHMPLFFFISGYLFRVHVEPAAKLAFVKKKVLHQLLPYFAFNLVFCGITIFLRRYGLFINNTYSLDNLFLEPFFTGHQTPLIAPMWFLLQLFVLNIVFQTMYWSTRTIVVWALSLPILVAGLYLTHKGLGHPLRWELLLVRTGFAAMFFQFGIIVARYKRRVSGMVSNPALIAVTWIAVSAIPAYFGNTSYSILWGSVENPNIFVPIVSSLLIVLMVYGISQIMALIVNEGSFILTIGQSSFWIMSLHLSVFFLVNAGFYMLGRIEKIRLEQVYSAYNGERTFMIYLAAGLLFPIFVSKMFHYLKESVKGHMRVISGHISVFPK
jgi:fucose 4-O-acetylase-like acetyltransferase